ncbi:MAG: NAD(P)/FAD-dependent oxidoreductase [Candidatus Altiarchaeota archaeon]
MKIAIIGSGITGLTSGYRLVKKGASVKIFEKEEEIGGLLSSFKFQNFYLERYYHHFFKCDSELIKLIEELGLKSKVIWKETKMGFFVDNEVYPFSTPFELLKFKPISFFDRIKFGLTILYLQRKKTWEDLENITAKEWLEKFSGKKTYELLWKPLLKIKFGSKFAEKISAAWIWGRVNPRAKSRSKGLMKEELGYLKGGFKFFLEKIENEIEKENGEILKNKEVKKIEFKKDKVRVFSGGNEYEFDKVIFTAPNPVLLNLTKLEKKFKEKLQKVKYQSVICATFLLRESLSDIYWLNISDEKIPFGGVIEHTNFIPKENYNNFSVVYVFNYIQKESRLYNLTDDRIAKIYKKGLKKIFPNFNEKIIENVFIHRNEYATPIYVKNYSKIKPNFSTPIKNLFLANTSMIYPFDRNVNNSVKLGNEIAEICFNSKCHS